MALQAQTLLKQWLNCRCARFVWATVGLLSVMFWPTGAYATGKTDAKNFGDIICNIQSGMNSYSTLISAVCYTMGAFLGVRGVLYLTERFNSQQAGMSVTTKGIAHILGGGALLSAPTFAALLQKSIFPSMGGTAAMGSACAGTAPTKIAGAASLDLVMNNLVKNISLPMFTILAGLSVAIGIFLIVRGLLKAAKYGVDPRSDNVKSITTNLLIGAVMISIGNMLPTVLSTLFGNGTKPDDISMFAGLDWSGVVGSSSTTAADNAIKAVLAFVQVIGGIAFVRGWLMIKNAIEGTGQQTVPQGITHIIGGAMCINIGMMLKILDTTFGTGLIK